MVKAKLVSVIIPVYNREKLIVEAVQSVYGQTHRPIECVIVDDGSSDQSVDVIKQLIIQLNAEDFSIKLFQQKNAGAPTARNKGLKHANGEFIQFLDSDDLLYVHKIQDQVSFLEKHKAYDGVYGDWHHGTVENYDLIKGEKWDDTISQFYGGRVIHTLSFLFRRQIIDKIGPWDETLKRNQEIDYFLRGVLTGGNFDYLPQITGLWREHTGERIVNSSGALSALAFHDKWFNEFKKLGLMNAARKKTVAYFFFWHAMELEQSYTKEALQYLYRAFKLYQDFSEFNTQKMRILRALLGAKLSLRLWHRRAKLKINKTNN